MSDYDQKDKLEALRNEQLLKQGAKDNSAQTYFERAVNEIAEAGGRFVKPVHITAATPPPTLNSPTSPWVVPDPVGTEPPLGFEVDAQQPVGTVREQAEAARIAENLSGVGVPAESKK